MEHAVELAHELLRGQRRGEAIVVIERQDHSEEQRFVVASAA